jgi:UDP-arabinose 4-epimerase
MLAGSMLHLRKVLVAGGAGYIGSHACKALHAAGITPVTFDDLSAGKRELVRWGPLVEGSLADTERVRDAIRTHGCEAVLHFAALTDVGESVAAPRRFVRNNVCGTVSLLDAMLDEGVRTIVFSSSCAVYGVPPELPIHEGVPLAPISPYGESKRYVEEVLRTYERAYGLKWTALRYFNAAGADPGLETGELHEPETHLIPLAILAALGKRAPVLVHGSDYPTPDGTAVRDYVHVSDLANGHVQALARLDAAGEPLAANLGSGRGHSVLEVFAAIERVLGVAVPHRMAERRAGDPAVLVADATLARTQLGFTPTLSSIDTIIETAARWISRGPAR